LNKRAFVIILVGLALLMIASTIRSGWLYLVSSMLFAVVVIGLFSGIMATRKLSVTRDAPAEVFEREPFDVSLTLDNRARTTRRLLKVRDLQFAGRRRSGLTAQMREQRAEFKEFMRTGKVPPVRDPKGGAQGRTVAFEAVGGRSTARASYKVSAPRRGVYGPAKLAVSSGGVFGTAEIKRRRTAGGPLTVFPAIHHVDAFDFDPRASLAPVEPIEWARKGIGQDYYGIREYTPGDPLRHIHWPSSARLGRFIVKEYEQELKPSVVIVSALFPPMAGDKDHNSMEDGLRAVASLTSLHESRGGLPLLVLPGDGGFAAMEPATFYGCLEALARYEPPPRTSGETGMLLGALKAAVSSMLPSSALVLVTNAPPEKVAAALDQFGEVPGGSVVLVLDDSYGQRWSDLESAASHRLGDVAFAGLNLYAITSGREIGRCLSEPLNTTG